MNKKLISKRGILATLVVILLIVAVVTFPYAFNLTWSLPGASAERTLTYEEGDLTWDKDAKVNEDGSVQLSMFKSSYENVKSNDGSEVVAPKTGESVGVRIVNKSDKEIKYTAVLYRTDDLEVPLLAGLSGEGAVNPTLPEGVTSEQLVDTSEGVINGNNTKTVDVDWQWREATTQAEDDFDAKLATASEEKNVNYKLYVTVSDYHYTPGKDKDGKGNADKDGSTIKPKTSDNMDMKLWFALTVLSLCAVGFLLVRDTRDEKKEKNEN